MALGPLIFLAVLALIHHPLMVNDRIDSATWDRLQEHEKLIKEEMGRLQVELDQKGWNWDSKQVQDRVTAEPAADDGTLDGWHYVGLIILIFFGCCKHTMEKEPSYDSSTDSSSTTTNEDDQDYEDDMDIDPEYYGMRRKALEAFYDQHVEAEASDLSSLCDFVEAFVNDLLEACRNLLPYQNTLPLLENCIGVDGAFEGWHVQKDPKTFCVLVPVLPPKGHSFHVEASDSDDAVSKHGHIMVDMECMCKREKLLGDVVCFLHHPDHELSKEKQGVFFVHVLCTSSHLDVDKTVQWFQALVGKAWDGLRPKYNFDLKPQPSNTSCRLKLVFGSRRSISIDIVLGVQQGDSLVFLATQGTEMGYFTGTVWQRSFAIQELLFFKWVSQRVPEESCHLRCLQILMYLKKSSPSNSRNSALTEYHYKTCLMHLLLLRPLTDWGPEHIAPRTQDILSYMHRALQEKYLEHFLIGNISLPIQIPMPKALRSAAPLNLFRNLEQDRSLHAEAMEEFVEVVDQVKALWSEMD